MRAGNAKGANQKMLNLLNEASQMLQDRSRSEADLIYAVACLDNEERLAIRMSYKILFEEEENE